MDSIEQMKFRLSLDQGLSCELLPRPNRHRLYWNLNDLFNQNFYKWRVRVMLSAYLWDDHAFLPSSIGEFRRSASTGYVRVINTLVSAPRLRRYFQRHVLTYVSHEMHTACLRKTLAMCLIDRSLNLFSIRMFTHNAYGNRTRFSPYTTLKTGRPQG